MLLLLFTSCATVTNAKIKNDVAKRLFDLFDRHTSELSDKQIASVADRRPELPRPFNLAVYFKQPSKKENWSWNQKDRNDILSALSGRKDVIRKSFELINTGGGTEDLKSLRLMAAQQGADAVLIVQGAGKVRTDANGLAVSYVAIVPMLFANGNDVKSGFVTQAVLWDVRHSVVHAGLQGEGDWNMKRPLVFRQNERALSKAKEESIEQLEKELRKFSL